MIHLGRFVLLEINGQTGEGYTLMRSDSHRIVGVHPIFCHVSGNSIGDGHVIKIGEKYYVDVYDFVPEGFLTKAMTAGRRRFFTRGSCNNLDRIRASNYILTGIYLHEQKSSPSFQVDKFPTVLENVDLKSNAYKADNWLRRVSAV